MQSVDARGPPSNSSNSFTTPPPYTTPLGYPQNQLEMESPKVLAHNKHSKSLQSSPKAQFAHLLLPSVGSAADQSATAPTSPLATTKATQGVAGHDGNDGKGGKGRVIQLVEEFETLDVRVQEYLGSLTTTPKASPRGPPPPGLVPTLIPPRRSATAPAADLKPISSPSRLSGAINPIELTVAGKKRQHSADLDYRRTRPVSPTAPELEPLKSNKIPQESHQAPSQKPSEQSYAAPRARKTPQGPVKRTLSLNLSAALAAASREAADAAASGAAAARDAAIAAESAYATSRTNTAAAIAAAKATMAAAKAAAAAAAVATAAAAAASAASFRDHMGTLTASGTAITAASEVVQSAAIAVNAAAAAEAAVACV